MTKRKKEYSLMKDAKDTIALGTINTMGTYAFGRIGAAHPVTAPTANAAVAGLQLTQIGQTAKTGLNLAKMISDHPVGKKKRKY